MKKHKILLIIFDFFLVLIIFHTSIWFKFNSTLFSANIFIPFAHTFALPISLFLGFLVFMTFQINNLYNYNILLNIYRHMVLFIKSIFIVNIFLIMFLFLIKNPLIDERIIIFGNLIGFAIIFILFRVFILY